MASPVSRAASAEPFALLVHCHLRWDFVWQRPQHVISRLAKTIPVVFLEDAAPLPPGETEPKFSRTQAGENLLVVRPLLLPHTGDAAADAATDEKNGAAWHSLLEGLIPELRETDTRWNRLVHWFYTPMAGGSRTLFGPVAVAYDCMDELANFKNAPAGIAEREAELLADCDVVFTGGPSLYAARKDKHPNIHQFNSGVDTAHFGAAQSAETVVPEDMAALPSPRLLYYGVLDERLDWDALAAVCDSHPDWSVLLVGPLAKITEADLLRRPNLYYTGQRAYEDLPGYLKGADVALVPFALTDATRFLSPTKTLEYFAARVPVVSTPIPDIVRFYGDAARIAGSPEEFIQACEAALAKPDEARLDAGEKHAAAQTWDSIAGQMQALLSEAVAGNDARRTAALSPAP